MRTAIRVPDELVVRRDGKSGALAHLVGEVAKGHRGFVIVPLVHPAEVEPDQELFPGPPPTDVETAIRLIEAAWPEAAAVAGQPATTLRHAVVHGQMKASERDAVMERFRAGEVDVLIGTTVLEVGVDVPQATLMIVLDADRFGVAQLHQLRGRVGRGTAESGCVLVSGAWPDPGIADEKLGPAQLAVRRRLAAVRDTSDGFALAELDFELRGEGKLLGLQQSGLPPLRVADLSTRQHRELSVRARGQAEALVDDGGRLRPGLDGLEAELAGGWLRRVGAGDVLAADELDA